MQGLTATGAHTSSASKAAARAPKKQAVGTNMSNVCMCHCVRLLRLRWQTVLYPMKDSRSSSFPSHPAHSPSPAGGTFAPLMMQHTNTIMQMQLHHQQCDNTMALFNASYESNPPSIGRPLQLDVYTMPATSPTLTRTRSHSARPPALPSWPHHTQYLPGRLLR